VVRNSSTPGLKAGPTGAVVLVLVTLLAACTPREVPYDEEIATHRAQYDEFMQSSKSPVPKAERAAFKPLNYFPVDAAYRVPASFTAVEADDYLEMDTSDGARRRMRRIGTLAFTLKGTRHALTAFVDAKENDTRRLFVPFGDLTAGTETYPGGRYLDLDRMASGVYDLDFNRAYHPYCYYNPEYVCPVPPRENRLPVPIRAGEKLLQ
jgi:uncharacterized protein (DUF1684 family)